MIAASNQGWRLDGAAQTCPNRYDLAGCWIATLVQMYRHICARGFSLLSAVQIWNPDDWELFALSLLQRRHGALNVHKIPAQHKGDFGIDYYCTKEAVAYQCYSVDEPVEIGVRADRQKGKITTDLAKLITNQKAITKLFMGVPVRHWVLLSPRHDSKEVNLHCSKKTVDMRKTGCPALSNDFEVSIQDQSIFPSDVLAASLRQLTNVKLSVPAPSQHDLDSWAAGSSSLIANATHKLSKKVKSDQLANAVAAPQDYSSRALRCLMPCEVPRRICTS